ncbi:MAG: hypothetical protein SVU32_03525, partial [Candidatus Nanohaloarchaea archaeon]|nr:hypothetical protein [Candidatus Nanohaloarchaea archaeon]
AYQDILESVPDYASDRLEEKYGQTLNDHEFSFDDELPRIGRPIEHIDTDIDPDVTVLAVQYGPEDTEDEQDNTERRKRGGGSDGSLNGPAAKPTTEFYDI